MMEWLRGKRIAVTRELDQAKHTAAMIERRGGLPIYFPCLKRNLLLESVQNILPQLQKGSPEVLLFTSANGVDAVAAVLQGEMARVLAPHRRVVVGAKTAARLNHYGVVATDVAGDASQEGVVDLLVSAGLPARLFFFRAEVVRDRLCNVLRAQGCDVIEVICYRMDCPMDDAQPFRSALEAGAVDAILLGSSQTARYFLQRIENSKLAATTVIVTISEAVTLVAQDLGFNVQVTAKQANFESMLDGLSELFAKQAVLERENRI